MKTIENQPPQPQETPILALKAQNHPISASQVEMASFLTELNLDVDAVALIEEREGFVTELGFDLDPGLDDELEKLFEDDLPAS
jgi:hypothetical protein